LEVAFLSVLPSHEYFLCSQMHPNIQLEMTLNGSLQEV